MADANQSGIFKNVGKTAVVIEGKTEIARGATAILSDRQANLRGPAKAIADGSLQRVSADPE